MKYRELPLASSAVGEKIKNDYTPHVQVVSERHPTQCGNFHLAKWPKGSHTEMPERNLSSIELTTNETRVPDQVRHFERLLKYVHFIMEKCVQAKICPFCALSCARPLVCPPFVHGGLWGLVGPRRVRWRNGGAKSAKLKNLHYSTRKAPFTMILAPLKCSRRDLSF